MSSDGDFENLRTLFAADLTLKIGSLKAAVRVENWDEVDLIAHQIKGSAKSFGYPEISGVAAELERSVAERSLIYAAGLIDKMAGLLVL